MKILIVTPIYPPEIGGPATYVSELQKRLIKKHSLTVIAFSNSKSKTQKENVHLISTNQPFPSSLIRQLKLAWALYRLGKKSDIIYAQGPIVVGFVSTLVSKLIGKPVYLKFVGDIAWEEAERRGVTTETLEVYLNQKRKYFPILVIQILQKMSFNLARNIIVPSNYLKLILTNHYKVDENKIKVIFNAVEIPKNLEKAKDDQSSFTIISIGRMVHHKRFDLLIEAFSLFIQKIKDNKTAIKLVLVGDGPVLERLKTIAKNKNLTKSIIFTGKLKREEALSLLKDSQVFTLTSEYEGLPHVIIESMLLEVPVITSDIPGIREVVTNNQSGLLVKNKKIEIAQAINSLFNDKKLANKLKNNAKRKAQEKFNWKTHTESLIHLFREELAKAKAR